MQNAVVQRIPGNSDMCDIPVSSRSQTEGVEGTLLADVTSPHGKNHRIVFYRDINVLAFKLIENKGIIAETIEIVEDVTEIIRTSLQVRLASTPTCATTANMDPVCISYTDAIVVALKRKEILLELNESRTPDSNRRKLRAWTEIRDVVLVKCRKLMTILQIKRVWRSKKAHVRDLLLKERRYRQATGGGVDVDLERTIMKASESLTEAELQLANCLGREAITCGIGRMETYVDKQGDDERVRKPDERVGRRMKGVVGGIRQWT
ncbi:unnamed protein product [Cylicocyclus nassatus]|uniref:Uncharacterized protein n=1 Tax=Cylicocyclus nassatus TaxID=53992 RepID=A0AA36HBC8_CYLNA|nr:unnamed protein product [Cylicocyclus nassatus]